MPGFAQNAAWQANGTQSNNGRQSGQRTPVSKEVLKARNRAAAKKWRDKKEELLYELEAENDKLREDALRLRNESLSLQTENQVLEDELRFFQSFMTKIMNVTPRQQQSKK